MLGKRIKSNSYIFLAMAIFSSFFCAFSAFAIDTVVLPENVRAFVFKHAEASVPDSYGSTGVEKSFAVQETLTAALIKSVSPDVEDAYNKLYALDANLASNLNMGYVDLAPKINVKANAFALAWGLTDRWMIATAIPVMSADVSLSGGFYNTMSINQTVSALQAYASDPSKAQAARNQALALANALSAGVPQPKGEYLQGVIVNDYGYKPVGNWNASGIGDLQVFSVYKLINNDNYKQAIKGGIDLPTGRIDDPDNLLDVPFGTGYFATYLETLHDFVLVPGLLTFSSGARYTYNWSTDRTFRLSPSSTFPLTSRKESLSYKPGNSITLAGEVSAKFFRSLGGYVNYTYKRKESDSIQGVDPSYNYTILSTNTNSSAHSFAVGVSYSTVDLFLRKKFPVPFKLGISMSRVFRGINTERVNITSADFEMYF